MENRDVLYVWLDMGKYKQNFLDIFVQGETSYNFFQLVLIS